MNCRFYVLFNKDDLNGEFSVDEAEIKEMQKVYGWNVLRTSAKTGEKVEQAFYELAELMLKKN